MTRKTRIFMAGSAAVMAAGLCTGLIAYFAGGFQSLSASTGPTELQYVPSDAAVIAYADVRSIMGSEFRQHLKSAMPMGGQSGQQEFHEKTGIDIERDIDYVVAAMTGAQTERPHGLVVARGRFDNVQLEGFARDHGGITEEYRGKRLVSSTQRHNGDQFTIAFLEPGLVAVGDVDAVKHSINAQLSAQSITSNTEMMDLVGDIEQSSNAWAVGRFDVLRSQAKLPEHVAGRLPALRLFAAAGRINGGISGSFRAEARDEQAAQQLRDIVRGFLALAQMQSQNDPRLASLAQSMQLAGEGTTVSLSFTIPAELLQMIQPKQPRVQ